MANKTVSFRLPEELITALEDHAKRSGKTKTDLVIEALAETYGIAMPISSSITITSVQQQIETLKEEIALLTKSSSEVQAELQEYTTNFIVALKQALQPLESVSSFSLKKGELSPTLMEGSVVSESVSNPALEVISLQTLRQPSTGITLLNMDSTYDPGQLATQIEYQIQVFDKVFSAIPELIFICDRSGHFTYISPFANRVWGIERNEMLGKLYHEVNLPPEFLEFNLSQFEFALSFGKLSSAELSISSSSRTRYYDYSLSPIQEDRGGVIGVVGTAIDITQRKQAELALQESLKRYHNLFELANDMIFIVDVESHQIQDLRKTAMGRV